MCRPLSIAIALACLLAAAGARAAIYRCVGPGGTDVFTDRPCASLSMPARDMRGTQGTPGPPGPASWRSGSRALVAGCPAATAEALMAQLETGLARRDVNQLSGLFLWTGISHAGGRELTARLRRLVDRELIEIRFLPEADLRADYAEAPADWDPYVDPPPRIVPTGIVVRHAARGGEYLEAEETRLAIRHHAECLWLAF